jgi:hypothetical protein
MLIPTVSASEGFWPITGAGWVALGGVFVSLLTTAFAWGRWTQKTTTVKEELTREFDNHKNHVKNVLDGFGGRVESMESEHDHINGRLDEASGHVQRILGQHDSILGLLGEAKGSTVQCREDTQALGEKIERKLEGMTREMADTKLHLSERLKGVETKLEIALERKP